MGPFCVQFACVLGGFRQELWFLNTAQATIIHKSVQSSATPVAGKLSGVKIMSDPLWFLDFMQGGA